MAACTRSYRCQLHSSRAAQPPGTRAAGLPRRLHTRCSQALSLVRSGIARVACGTGMIPGTALPSCLAAAAAAAAASEHPSTCIAPSALLQVLIPLTST